MVAWEIPGASFNYMVELVPAWIINHVPSKVWDEITYSVPNFNGTAVEVWEVQVISSHTL